MATWSGHEMALRIAVLLEQAFAIEGHDDIEVKMTAGQIVRVRRGRDRYDLTVVKKRASY